jgi:hypothetical protein
LKRGLKVRGESEAGSGLLGTTKKVIQELDRQVSGAYEHREDDVASESPDVALPGGDAREAYFEEASPAPLSRLERFTDGRDQLRRAERFREVGAAVEGLRQPPDIA